MADKERRNSLIRSSISINSIRDSASEFSKGLDKMLMFLLVVSLKQLEKEI